MKRLLARGRPPTCLPKPRFAGLAYAPLREVCAAAYVPMADAGGNPLPDIEVAAIVAAARRYRTLQRAAVVLVSESRRGELPLASYLSGGPIGFSEALVLASVLRSPVADGVA